MFAKLISYNSCVSYFLQKYLNDAFLLFLRVAVSIPFFNSGMIKFNNWDSTLYLFEEEYQVPLLPFELAAYMATAGELVLPVLLILGLMTQGAAVALFFLNAMAVISYPVLWEGGFYDHKMWGLMLFSIMFLGAGKWSLDWFINKDK